MKLAHLFEGPEFPWKEERDMPRRSDDKMQATVKSRLADPNVEYVGSGASAFVSRSTSPHHMDSVERISLDEDPTSVYLSTILQTPSLHDNPYLPRVRSINRDGNIVSVVAERLHPYQSERLFTSRMIEAIWDRITDEPLPSDPSDQMFALEDLIQKALYNKAGSIKDPQFAEAIAFIQQVKRKTHGTFDIHDGNLMWRVTGTMPNLVIVDPIS